MRGYYEMEDGSEGKEREKKREKEGKSELLRYIQHLSPPYIPL